MWILETPFFSDLTHIKTKQNPNQNSVWPSFVLPDGILAANPISLKERLKLIEVSRALLLSLPSFWFISDDAQPSSGHMLLRLSTHHPCLTHLTNARSSQTVLARGQLWPWEIVIKGLPSCMKKLETSLAPPRYLEITYQAQFDLIELPECAGCAKKKKKPSSQPKRQRLPPTQALKYTCNLYFEARLMPVKASAGFWPDSDAGEGGILLWRVCLYLPLRCFHWSDPGGRRSGWIPGFTSSCASQTVLTVAQFRQAKDLVAHQAHSFPLSS